MSKSNELQTQEKHEVQRDDNAERLADRRLYQPRADIYETEDSIYLVANMAGVDDTSVDITLEKNVLTIKGHPAAEIPEEMELAYSEYAVGDYERSFVLSDEVDRGGIDATVQDGVLRVTLPKSEKARTKKIPISAA